MGWRQEESFWEIPKGALLRQYIKLLFPIAERCHSLEHLIRNQIE